MKTHLPLLALLFISLSACENFFESTVTIDPPQSEPRIAVHAFNVEDSIRLLVSRTVGPLESTDDSFLNDAEVSIRRNGSPLAITTHTAELVSDTFFFSETEFYVWEYLTSVYNFQADAPEFETGAVYELEVKHTGMPTVKASQTYPALVPVDSVVFIENAGVDQFGDPSSAIDIYFRDPAGVENYYAIDVVNGIPEVFLSPMFVTSNDPATFQAGSMVCFQDGALDGQSRRIRVSFFRSQFSSPEFMFVRWHSLTPDHFNYLQRLERYYNSNGNPFVTPAQLYSNIENGVGIFALSNSVLIPLQ